MASLRELIDLGKDMGLEGEALQEWVRIEREEKRRREDLEENKRKEQMELEEKKRKEQMELEEKKRKEQMEFEREQRAADREIRRLELEMKKEKDEIKANTVSAPKIKLPYFDEKKDDIDAYLYRFERHAQRILPRAE